MIVDKFRLRVFFVVLMYATLFVFASFLSSCSSEWHLKRAIAKDPTIITVQHDTLIKTIEDTGKVSFLGQDTTINNDKVFIQVTLHGGSTDVFWMVKPQVIEVPTNNTTIKPSKSNAQIRQEGRTNRVNIKESNKTERKKIKSETKTQIARGRVERTKIKNSSEKGFWNYIKKILIFLIGFLLGYVFKSIRNIVRTNIF